LRQNVRSLGYLFIEKEAIYHDIANTKYLVRGDAFSLEIIVVIFRGGEQIVGNMVGQKSVYLFRYASVVGAESSFDMGYRDVKF